MPSLTRSLSACLLLLLAPALGAQSPQERAVDESQRSALAVTIYNQDLALVKDTRGVSVDAGYNRLAIREVSARIQAETALLRSLDAPAELTLLEQNFDYDLLTPRKLLEKYLGREVGVVRTHPGTGAERIERATVLATNEGVVLRYPDRIEVEAPGRLVFDDVPPNLRDRPTLTVDLRAARARAHQLELSYLTSGLSWRADYVAELAASGKQLTLNGWVTLTNESGTSYTDTRLQLVAGDVNRVAEAPDPRLMRQLAATARPAVDEGFQQERLFEYHLYTLPRSTTIRDRQSKQIALLEAAEVPVTRELLLEGGGPEHTARSAEPSQRAKVAVILALRNDEASRLGVPLPRGIVRVYQRDAAGNAQFLGEDRIDHTPKNESLRLHLGSAFDVTAERRQTKFELRPALAPYSRVFASSHEIVLRNAKPEPVTVTVLEALPGEWAIREASHRYEEAAAGAVRWRIEIPPEGETLLSYSVEVRL
jgi:hypothetical protein